MKWRVRTTSSTRRSAERSLPECTQKAEEFDLNVKAPEVGEINDHGKGINEKYKGNHKESRRLAGTKALALPRATTRIHRALVVLY